MNASELFALVALVGSVNEAARLRLAAIAADIRALESEIADLAAIRPDPPTLAAPGGLQAHALHQRWTSARREMLLRRLAALRARFEAARLAAAQAHGRKTALDDVLMDAQKAAARHRDRVITDRLTVIGQLAASRERG